MPDPDMPEWISALQVGDIIHVDKRYADLWFDGFTGPYTIDYLEEEGGLFIGIKLPNGKYCGEGTSMSNWRTYSRAYWPHVRPDVFMNAVKEALKNA